MARSAAAVARLVRRYVSYFARQPDAEVYSDSIREYVTFHLFDGGDFDNVGGPLAVWAWLATDPEPMYTADAIERYRERGQWQDDIGPEEQLAAMVIIETVVNEALRVAPDDAAWERRWGHRRI